MTRHKVDLLPPEALIKSNALDQAEWNYQGALGMIQRHRFMLVAGILGPRRFDRLLEVGYGSGVFMPELSHHCGALYGVDPHDHGTDIAQTLKHRGVAAHLVQGSVTALPFEDQSFDAIVTVSSLEFVDDIALACHELARVLRPGGRLVAVTPGYAKVLDLGLLVLSGERAEDTFHGRRQGVIPALVDNFEVESQRSFPPVPGGWLYTVFGLTV